MEYYATIKKILTSRNVLIYCQEKKKKAQYVEIPDTHKSKLPLEDRRMAGNTRKVCVFYFVHFKNSKGIFLKRDNKNPNSEITVIARTQAFSPWTTGPG